MDVRDGDAAEKPAVGFKAIKTEDNLTFMLDRLLDTGSDEEDGSSEESTSVESEFEDLGRGNPKNTSALANQAGGRVLRRPSIKTGACEQREAPASPLSALTSSLLEAWNLPGPAPRPRMPKIGDQHERNDEQRVSLMMEKLRKRFSRKRRNNRRMKTAPGKLEIGDVDVEQPAVHKSRSATPKASNGGLGDCVILFDWDDTLLPTWYITEVVRATRPDRTHRRVMEDSPFYEPLKKHAALVADVLNNAASLGRTAIVTLAKRPWVEDSAHMFLPGLDLHGLLDSLDIPVYYAREHVLPRHIRAANAEEGLCLFMVAKREAMKRCLRKLLGSRSDGNVISIGDSEIEETAIREILWENDEGACLCKTVKLVEDPSLTTAGQQLELVCTWLESMVAHAEDFHINVGSGEGSLLEN